MLGFSCCLIVLGFVACSAPPPLERVRSGRSGLEVLASGGFSRLAGRRVGLVTNPTGVDADLIGARELLEEAEDVRLVALFGPEHGVRGAAQAGEKVADDADDGVPVYSLYGATRRPTAEMLAGIDLLLVDLQDIGVRTYTYLSTLVEVLEAAAERDIEVWVLDRPAPLGGVVVEGPVLDEAYRSFVGPHRIPLRHGLTPGEFALLVDAERGIGARLEVVRAEGDVVRPRALDEPRPWLAPSPNIPTPTAALAYAGTVLIEGTNLSEGRGTTRPFTVIGAPWLDAERLVLELRARQHPGVLFRAVDFTPTFSKHEGAPCRGVELHIVDPGAYRAVETAVSIIELVHRHHPEFEFRGEAFDRLAGTDDLRQRLVAGETASEIVASWRADLDAYVTRRAPYLLYPRSLSE